VPHERDGATGRRVRAGNGQASGGDWQEVPRRLARDAELDYLTLDYLAEVTMSLLHKRRSRRPEFGYPPGFVAPMRDILPVRVEREVKVVTNAGGPNPRGCRDAVVEVAREVGLYGVQVASISGDDLMPRLPEFLACGHELANLDAGEPFPLVEERLVAGQVHVYPMPGINALGIVLEDALDGDGLRSLLSDAQGKAMGEALLRMTLHLPGALASSVRLRTAIVDEAAASA